MKPMFEFREPEPGTLYEVCPSCEQFWCPCQHEEVELRMPIAIHIVLLFACKCGAHWATVGYYSGGR